MRFVLCVSVSVGVCDCLMWVSATKTINFDWCTSYTPELAWAGVVESANVGSEFVREVREDNLRL